MRRRTNLILLILFVAGVAGGILLFPDLATRWMEYNLKMLSKISSSVLSFFWIHLGIAALVFVIEAFVVGWRKSSLRQLFHPDKSMVSDICIFIVNMLQLDYVIIFILTLGVMHKLKLGVQAAINLDQGLLASTIQNPILQLIIYILIADFLLYLEHYLHHKLSFLWPFHSYHHSATELNILTANRGHPVQAELTNSIISIIPLTLMGFPLVSLLAFRICRNSVTFLHHSRLPWKWGLFGKYILVSPGYHRVHHSVLPEHYDKNLAVLFPLWDHLFGTYYKGSIPVQETGLPENLYNRKSFIDDMLVPFRMFRRTAEGRNRLRRASSVKDGGREER